MTPQELSFWACYFEAKAKAEDIQMKMAGG
jgi:hypothetical protein